MKLLLLAKWALFVLFVALAWVLAMPLLCTFTALDRKGSAQLFHNFGARLRYAIESDFRGVRIRQANAVGSNRGRYFLALVALLVCAVVLQILRAEGVL